MCPTSLGCVELDEQYFWWLFGLVFPLIKADLSNVTVHTVLKYFPHRAACTKCTAHLCEVVTTKYKILSHVDRKSRPVLSTKIVFECCRQRSFTKVFFFCLLERCITEWYSHWTVRGQIVLNTDERVQGCRSRQGPEVEEPWTEMTDQEDLCGPTSAMFKRTLVIDINFKSNCLERNF